jgi:hypothetical protein
MGVSTISLAAMEELFVRKRTLTWSNAVLRGVFDAGVFFGYFAQAKLSVVQSKLASASCASF